MNDSFFKKLIKYFFFLFIVKPFVFWVLGINVRGSENLPGGDKAAVIVANHNSHVDTLIIMSLFLTTKILKIHPVAARDYFCNTKLRSFMFETLIGIIPIDRHVKKMPEAEFFKDINDALAKNHIILIYPEGTRGDDNKIGHFKTGIAHIAKMNPGVPVIPLYINGPDRILPKFDNLIVPFISDIYVGEAIYYDGSSATDFTQKIQDAVYEMYNMHRKKEEL